MAKIHKNKQINFTQKVYHYCKQIPKGKISTYAEIAKAIGNKAYRAVGNALNKNPHAPQVPCHRIIKSDGTIGGFAHGTQAKKEILTKEGIQFDGNKIKDFEKKLHKISHNT